MTKITIDSKEYELDSFTDEAKAQLQSLQFVDAELVRLQAQIAVLQTARAAYANALKVTLSMPVTATAGDIAVTAAGQKLHLSFS